MDIQADPQQKIRVGSFVFLIAPAVFFLFAVNSLHATGAKVLILLLSGQEIRGELLLVSDSILVISKSINVSQDKLEADPNGLFTVRRGEIKSLTVCGKSYIPDGMLLGCVFGTGVGTLVSYEPTGAEAYRSNFDPFGPGSRAIIIGFAGGTIIGGLLGAAATKSDREISLEGRKNLLFLEEYSRYYNRSIPAFLERYVSSTSDATQPP